MQTANPCEFYLKSTEVIRIVQSNNETFINRVLDCIRASKQKICCNVITRHRLVAADLLQLCRDDAFQQAQLILLREIQLKRFAATTATCLPFLKKTFRRQYWQEYQKEIGRWKKLENLNLPNAEEMKDNSPDDKALKVRKLIAKLTPTERETYRLYYVEQLTIKEIAALLGIETKSVTKQLMRLHEHFDGLWK